jgi:hypothetical protein
MKKSISSEKENRKNHQKTQDKYRQEYQSSESQGLETTGPIIFQTGIFFDDDGTIPPTTRVFNHGLYISYKVVSLKRPQLHGPVCRPHLENAGPHGNTG